MYFLNVAAGKLFGTAVWISTFDRLGGSQTGRYVTGTVQLLGAILILIPRTQTAGVILLAITMLGATFAWTVVLREPLSPMWSGLVLATLVGLLVAGRDKRAGARA